ncbi:MAG TPA: hypothetical protein VF941_02990 [Clostridia bacterium]
MDKKYKIKHKTEGWTGVLEVLSERSTGFSSHGCVLEVNYHIWQDSHKPDGTYVEDPEVESLDELEIGEEIKNAE